MATIVDARGKLCPQPVIETKKAIQEQGTPVITMVDDDIARQNVEKMAQQMGLYAESSEIEGGFRILIQPISSDVLSAVMGDAGAAMEQILPTLEPAAFPVQQSRNEPTIVVLSSSCMGTGDDALGAALMKGFVYALTQLNEAPDVILLYNGGAKLSTEGADTVADLKILEAHGTEILTCGTCLAHYGLTDVLAVGSVTNMYAIAEILMGAGKVVRP